jgi:hyperosmotically inducible periplasmic protein
MKASVWIAAMTVAAGLISAQPSQDALSNHVRHELVTLPYFSVFDDLSYRVDGSTVTLFGEVTRPILKSEAEGAVKHVEGVTRVVNNIEVLPPSPMDDQIRVREYRTIFGYGPLQRYSMGVIPSIHIIVKNGHVTLTGYVSSEMDKQLAYTRANGVSNVFSVTNDLKVDQ